MDILIINHRNSGRLTRYTPNELRREARGCAKQYDAKLHSYFVQFHEGNPSGAECSLVVDLQHKDGWHSQVNVAL